MGNHSKTSSNILENRVSIEGTQKTMNNVNKLHIFINCLVLTLNECEIEEENVFSFL